MVTNNNNNNNKPKNNDKWVITDSSDKVIVWYAGNCW